MNKFRYVSVYFITSDNIVYIEENIIFENFHLS
jgi:hypothetical protein